MRTVEIQAQFSLGTEMDELSKYYTVVFGCPNYHYSLLYVAHERKKIGPK